MSSKKLTLVSNNNGAVETKSLVSDGRSPVKVKVQPHAKYLLVDENGQVAPENVTLTRTGDDLQVAMEGDSSPSLVLEGYFAQPESNDPAGLYSGAPGGGAEIVGTGYNDTFFAQTGTAVYQGSGGTTTVSGVQAWTDTGGMDIVDYKLAGSTPLTIDLYLTGAQYTGYNTATFKNIEGIAGGSGNDRFTNGTGDDQFEGRGGNDYFNLVHSGHDTLLYKVLNAADATGGNGTDTVDHFTVGTWEATPDASRLDLTDLLIGYTRGNDAKYINGVATIDASDHITDYLKVTTDGTNTTVWVDRDGAGGQFNSTALVVLNNVQTDLATLLANHQIV